MSKPSDLLVADFKAAMRRLAATVNIVTATVDGKPVGMAATAVTSLSTQPPSILVCVNGEASIHAAILHTGRFCVNILGADNETVCEYFGGKYSQEERFAATHWEVSDEGLPFLSDAQSALFCELAGQFDHGTHTVFVGNAKSIRIAGDVNPLLYANGRYCSVRYAAQGSESRK